MAWYRSQIREHGVVAATRVMYRVAVSRFIVGFSNRFLPSRVECPCCGWSGSRFQDYIEVGYRVRGATCPRCDSHPRHRLLHLWLNATSFLKERRGFAFVFAAEPALEHVWKSAALYVCHVDLASDRGTDLIADIQTLPIRSSTANLIWCHHVLEHIERDDAALREFARILKPEGVVILSVPQDMKAITTREYGAPDPMESGHWRAYGRDFPYRCVEAGLSVEEITWRPTPAEVSRHGAEYEPIFIGRATALARA